MDVDGTLDLDYRLRLCAPTSASRVISAVAELLVIIVIIAVVKNALSLVTLSQERIG